METNNKTTKKNKAIYILPLVIGALLFYGVKKYMHAINHEETDNAQIETNAVPVITRIAGYVDSVSILDYEKVQKGQLVVSIDSREYQIAVQQAEADLLTADADLSAAISNLKNSGANSSVAKANAAVQQVRLQKAKNDLKRDEALFQDGSITKKQLEDSKTNYETAVKMLTANNEQVGLANSQTNTTEAQIQKARAMVEVRKAALEQAKLRLTYTKVYSPIDGKIGKRNLEIGQYVQPGQALFTVVNDEKFWVVANFKETQLKNLKTGQTVNIKLDGYPDVAIKGKVGDMSEATGARFALLPPDNASGNFVKITQRVPVKIEIVNLPEVKKYLKAGLSVNAEVIL